jgi:hypothetical protein
MANRFLIGLRRGGQSGEMQTFIRQDFRNRSFWYSEKSLRTFVLVQNFSEFS